VITEVPVPAWDDIQSFRFDEQERRQEADDHEAFTPGGSPATANITAWAEPETRETFTPTIAL